jgi:hypothetical protein
MNLTPRDKRMLQVLGVVAGLALAYFLFTTVLGGEDGDAAAGPTAPTVVPSDTPSVAPTTSPRPTLPPVIIAGARDPFSPPPGLDATPVSTVLPTGGPTGGTTPPTTTTTAPPPPPPPPTTTPPTTTPPTTTSPPPPPPRPDDHIQIGGHDVTLEAVNSRRDRLQVEVDGRLFTVEEGAPFDESFRLVDIDGNCARFLFGDQSFTLCERRN